MKPTVGFLLLFLLAPIAGAANWPDRPTLRAVRAASAPVIDGDLSDAVWQTAEEFTDFTQHDPNDGQPASMRTSFRVLYDDEAIYFGAMMSDPERPTALLARRDSFLPSDFLSINIDSQHDRLSGAAFTVTPSNMQIDSILYNDIGEDGNWDAVWESESRIVPDGWVTEIRVPFSQLRFPEKDAHTWGINVTRRTVRNNEWVRIVNTRKGETGFVSHFADLAGLDGFRRKRQLELVPYAVVRSDLRTRVDANPLLESRDQRIDGGLDLKYALTSTLTLTGTVNPDFGQVEVDPAVVNLTEFETFYPEKRPFFTEGSNIFAFGDTPARSHFNFISAPQLFYSRRIGRSPQGSIEAEFVTGPSETTILGAAKVTGKLGKGWSVGVLNALTDAERARFVNGPERGRLQVEPMTNYFVSRVTREIGSGTRVGFLATSVNRRLPDELTPLRESAQTVGMDGYTSFRDSAWVLEWMAAGSRVSGSEEAIDLTQRASARYYQRPDAAHIELDPSRTALTGHASRIMLSKQTGLWRPLVQVQSYSPGFETNDAGFLQRSDIISAHAVMQYVDEEPSARTREKRLWAGAWNNRNFDGDTIERGVFADGGVTLSNYWELGAAVFLAPGSFSDRQTRGGPIVRTPRSWSVDLGVESDERRSVVLGIEGEFSGEEDGSYARGVGVTASFQPSSNLRLSISPQIERSHSRNQYVLTANDPTATATYGQRYVFAELEQRTFELSTRADWTLSSHLSFQLYVQPFVAAGDFHDYHSLVRARSADYEPYAPSVSDPDFNFRSVRGSAVVRWEFRPGSALYVVWNENRAEAVPLGDFRIGRDTRAIANAPSHDVFLVKFSYWLPM